MWQLPPNYDLEKHFDPNHPDVRIRLRDLFTRTKATIEREREISLEVTLLIGCLELKNAAVNLGFRKKEDLSRRLGLSPNMYWKRAQAARAFLRFPELVELVETGKTHISHVATISPRLTEANIDVYLAELPNKSEAEVKELVASINKDGSRNETEPTFAIKLTLTQSQMKTLERAREVLSATGRMPSDEEAILKSIEDLLEKRDPMRKAHRARLRKEKSKTKITPSAPKGECRPIHVHREAPSVPKMRLPIPSDRRHEVVLRDNGCCSLSFADGTKCLSRIGIQIDHIKPLAWGGTNEAANLRLLCREHNLSEAERLMGAKTMARYRGASIITQL